MSTHLSGASCPSIAPDHRHDANSSSVFLLDLVQTGSPSRVSLSIALRIASSLGVHIDMTAEQAKFPCQIAASVFVSCGRSEIPREGFQQMISGLLGCR